MSFEFKLLGLNSSKALFHWWWVANKLDLFGRNGQLKRKLTRQVSIVSLDHHIVDCSLIILTYDFIEMTYLILLCIYAWEYSRFHSFVWLLVFLMMLGDWHSISTEVVYLSLQIKLEILYRQLLLRHLGYDLPRRFQFFSFQYKTDSNRNHASHHLVEQHVDFQIFASMSECHLNWVDCTDRQISDSNEVEWWSKQQCIECK